MEKARSGCASAHINAPAQPSSGSAALTSSGRSIAFQREAGPVERKGDLGRQRVREAQQWLHFSFPLSPLLVLPCRPTRRAATASRATGSRSQQRQVSVQFELADVSLVRRPLGPLVADEPLEDVLTEGLRDEL